jgi:hypothetical protein
MGESNHGNSRCPTLDWNPQQAQSFRANCRDGASRNGAIRKCTERFPRGRRIAVIENASKRREIAREVRTPLRPIILIEKRKTGPSDRWQLCALHFRHTPA